MKRARIIALAAFALLLVAACSKNKKDEGVPSALVGNWELADITVKSANLGGQTVDVFLSFTSGKKFTEYQKLGDAGRYSVYKGTFKASKSSITRHFSDGTPDKTYKWKSAGDNLVLIDGDMEQVFSPVEAIPQEVLDNTY